MNHHELYHLISTDQTFGAIPMNFQKIHVDYLIILSAGQNIYIYISHRNPSSRSLGDIIQNLCSV